MVLLKIRDDVSADGVDAVFAALARLEERIEGILSFSGGAYCSGEGLERGFTHGFCMTFTDAVARDAYLPHPEHEAVKAMVLEVLDGGLDGVVAFDYES
ncbi:MAG: stress responsive protein [Planctomycetes bacterium]|jgi:hypothetical protein|nr:stress responsive protein [Planctomycetota bacterium]